MWPAERDHQLTAYIRWLTANTVAFRTVLQERRELTMPLELKGLKGKALKAAGHLDRINHAYDAFNEAAPAHAADVEGLVPQLEALQDDLTFATQTLGNSVAGSNAGATEKPLDSPAPPPLPQGREEPKPNPEPITGQQYGIKAAPMEFHG